MKKKSIKNLSLNKKVISNLDSNKIRGGDMPTSDPNSYRCTGVTQCNCNSGPQCDPLPIPTCGCGNFTEEPCFENTWDMCN